MNAKIIHRQAGDFTTAWGFGFDAGVQMFGERWKFGIVAKDMTTTFNAWSYNISQEWREVFYVTSNDIPSKSAELTAPQLIPGFSYNFPLNKKLSLLAEANFDLTFDGKRNTVISSNPISIDPRFGLELSYNNVFFVRGGINNFQKALEDRDTMNQKKIWIYQPALVQGSKLETFRLTMHLLTWLTNRIHYIRMYFL